MTKAEFLYQLGENLSSLPEADKDERKVFFGELIDDKIEEGMTEEDAVAEIGDPERIAEQIISEFNTPLPEQAKEETKKRRKLKAWEIVLICVGSPVWASLTISAVAVIVSLYASLWSVIVSFWAADLCFAVCAPAGLIAFFILLFQGNPATAFLMLGSGLILGGLAIFTFFGCKWLTVSTVKWTKSFFGWLKRLFGKEEIT